MARYITPMNAEFLFDYFAICFYIGSSALVLASWSCPYLNRIFTNGKHVTATNGSVWVSKSKFLHIYMWGFVTNLIVYITTDYSYYSTPLARILIALHTMRRAAEIIISSKRPYSKMNLLAYLYGLAFYTILPLVTYEGTTAHWYISVIAFSLASLLQCIVHVSLGRKRAYDKNVGIIFRYANHIAELVIFICIYLISPSVPSFLMTVYVFFCMSKLIYLNYKWYPKKK